MGKGWDGGSGPCPARGQWTNPGSHGVRGFPKESGLARRKGVSAENRLSRGDFFDSERCGDLYERNASILDTHVSAWKTGFSCTFFVREKLVGTALEAERTLRNPEKTAGIGGLGREDPAESPGKAAIRLRFFEARSLRMSRLQARRGLRRTLRPGPGRPGRVCPVRVSEDRRTRYQGGVPRVGAPLRRISGR